MDHRQVPRRAKLEKTIVLTLTFSPQAFSLRGDHRK
jgi:hypothetical protein